MRIESLLRALHESFPEIFGKKGSESTSPNVMSLNHSRG
jgi:hypothetical protein